MSIIFRITIFFFISITWMSGQSCINNPSIQQGDLNPAPLISGSGGVIKFSYYENLLDYAGYLSDPVSLTVCFLNIEPVNGTASVTGSFAGFFGWKYDKTSNCLFGIQNQTIIGGTGGIIKVIFNPINNIECPNKQMGFNANIQPAACMNGINQLSDDTESVYACSIQPDIVPVELALFAGKEENCLGHINWSTQSEINFSHFELEKSTDGSRFYTITSIEGTGSQSQSSTYSFIDKQLKANNFYRLKSVDFDGQIAYSKIIFIKKDCAKTNLEFDIYPNPVINNQLFIQIDSKWREQATSFLITDMLGRVVQRFDTILEKGGNEVKLNVENLANATYLLTVEGKDLTTQSRKFIKLSSQ